MLPPIGGNELNKGRSWKLFTIDLLRRDMFLRINGLKGDILKDRQFEGKKNSK